MALSGLERLVRSPIEKQRDKEKINMIAYADDFVVTAASRELLESKVLPTLTEALAKVGLELSIEKTKITRIDEGFDFLGFNVRKYKNGKLLIKPAKANVIRFLQEIRATIEKGVALPTEQLIHTLNSRLTGWVNYYRTSVSSDVFAKIDHEIVHALLRWGMKRHARKGKKWIVKKYFTSFKGNNWQFHCITEDKKGNPKPLYLRNAQDTRIRRHVKIKSEATPFNPLYKEYFKQREEERNRRKTISNYNDSAGLRVIQPS
jgi:RNA-directed DNA polymerase